jgi:hypothetical protein
MSFLYPRTIAITRPIGQTGIGAAGYGGEIASAEVAVASGLAASIQLDRQGRDNKAGLPGDAKTTLWRVLIPKSEAADGLIHSRDIITDDLGKRYQVIGPYWISLGYNCLCELQEV